MSSDSGKVITSDADWATIEARLGDNAHRLRSLDASLKSIPHRPDKVDAEWAWTVAHGLHKQAADAYNARRPSVDLANQALAATQAAKHAFEATDKQPDDSDSIVTGAKPEADEPTVEPTVVTTPEPEPAREPEPAKKPLSAPAPIVEPELAESPMSAADSPKPPKWAWLWYVVSAAASIFVFAVSFLGFEMFRDYTWPISLAASIGLLLLIWAVFLGALSVSKPKS